MMHTISGHAERTSRQTSMPLPSGSRTSSTATFGLASGIRAIASRTVAASPTTSRSSVGLDERSKAGPHHLVIVKEKDA